MPIMNPETAGDTGLYRIFGVGDLPLYVGMSNDFGRRWKEHARRQSWWDEKRWMTVHWYGTRVEAEAAEAVAILAERPKYNKQHPAVNEPEPIAGPHACFTAPGRCRRPRGCIGSDGIGYPCVA